MFSSFLVTVVDLVWGWPLLTLLIGGGIYLAFCSRLLPLTGFKHALDLIAGRVPEPGAKVEGQLSHFQALCTALAGTIGLGNIAGVAVAISQGGPGALFWMWVASLIGMNTKFFECTLAVMYRGKDYLGEVQGGPMYVIEKALPRKFHWLGMLFAICGLLGCMALFQINQLSSFAQTEFSIPGIWSGVLACGFVLFVQWGGVKRIGSVAGTLVPIMTLFYVLAALGILFTQKEKIPQILTLIFREAFQLDALFGGGAGVAIVSVIQVGVKRAAFSNEAGVGTAPMAHSNARTAHPIREGYVAMLGPFIDTILICTLTALVILVSLDSTELQSASGVLLTKLAFTKAFGDWGLILLGIAVLLFSVTTMIGMANYFEKCWHYLFRGRLGLGRPACLLIFGLSLLVGSVSATDDVVNILDIGYGLMAFPNMIATILLGSKVTEALRGYHQK